MMMETTFLDRDVGLRMGRLAHDDVEGSYAFALGDVSLSETTDIVVLGDFVEVTQFATLPANARTLRATGEFVASDDLLLPSGMAWRASLVIDELERATKLYDGRSFTITDLGANVASLAGQAVKLSIRIRAVDPDVLLPIEFGALVSWNIAEEFVNAPGGDVERWESAFGTAGAATAAGAARPTLQANAFGTHPAVRFGAATHVLTMPTTDVVPFDAWTYFAVCRPDNDAAEHILLDISTAPTDGSSLRISTLGTSHRVIMSSVAPTATLSTVASVTFAVPHVLAVTCDGLRRRIYVDGALVASDVADQSNLRAALLTGNIGNAVSSFGGDLFEQGVIARALSAWETALLTGGLRIAYGLT